MATPSAVVGICSSILTPLNCDGSPDLTSESIVYCGLTDVTVTPVLSDGLTIQDPSGIPGEFCLDIEVPAVVRYYDVSITTCSVFDVRMDNMIGNSDPMVDASNEVIGIKAQPKANQQCVCACEQEDACARRTGLVIYSMNLCPNTSGVLQFHPDGRNMVTVFPGIEWVPNTNPIMQLNANASGRSYTGRSYENQNYGQGPGQIIPATELPTTRCFYQFPTDECPPGGCDCGACGEAPPVAPAFA